LGSRTKGEEGERKELQDTKVGEVTKRGVGGEVGGGVGKEHESLSTSIGTKC
jgi:hypothetical protein